MSKHTKGKISAEELFLGWLIATEDGTVIASEINSGSDMGEANAARIVECWNACEGIENPTEFIKTAKLLMEAAKGLKT